MQCCLFYCIMENEQRGMITFILAVCGNVDYVYSFPQSPPSRGACTRISSRHLITGHLTYFKTNSIFKKGIIDISILSYSTCTSYYNMYIK